MEKIVTAAFVLLAAGAATAIQLWFRVQARRSQFRRRQTSSRIATFAEAFSSVGWAATSVLALVIPVLAAITATLDCWSPWLMLTRKASAPAWNSVAIISGVLLAGPRVASTRTFRERGAMAVVMDRLLGNGRAFL